VPLAAVTGSFDLTIPLRSIGRQVDVRQLTALVVSTDDPRARVGLEQLELIQVPAAAPRSLQTGFWVWGYRAAAADPDIVIAACQRQGCSRILIQMPALSDDDALWAACLSAVTSLAMPRNPVSVPVGSRTAVTTKLTVMRSPSLRR